MKSAHTLLSAYMLMVVFTSCHKQNNGPGAPSASLTTDSLKNTTPTKGIVPFVIYTDTFIGGLQSNVSGPPNYFYTNAPFAIYIYHPFPLDDIFTASGPIPINPALNDTLNVDVGATINSSNQYSFTSDNSNDAFVFTVINDSLYLTWNFGQYGYYYTCWGSYGGKKK